MQSEATQASAAPTSPASAPMDNVAATARPQAIVTLEAEKRLKTHGEKKFNWLTYGGVALLGNEAASLVITTLAEDKNGVARGPYAPFKKFFTDMKGKKFVPEYAWNGGLPKVLIALIGGMLMVPFVKHLEDNKGKIVRKFDQKYYGDAAQNDPAIIAADEEMDDAPKQSWGSLWKGRVVTVLAAIGVDSLVGWKDAPSRRCPRPRAAPRARRRLRTRSVSGGSTADTPR